MAHYAKYTKGSAGSLTRHYERAKNSKGEYIKFKNESIDTSRTHLNYNLAPHQQGQLDFIKERLENVHCLKRDDVKVMCSWVVTVPQTVPEEHQREFFERTYKHLEERYGKQNVISAYVHMDETTPHMHFAFVPVVYDRKKDREKVSAKECVTRADLKEFHTDLQAEIDQWKEQRGYDFECDVLNGATESGNLTIQGLKAKELAEMNENEEAVLDGLIDMCNEYGGTAQMLQIDIENLTEERERLKEGIIDLETKKSTLEDKIADLEDKLDALKGNKVTIMARFIESTDIKPMFEKFCNDWIERIRRQKEKREEKRMERAERGVGTMEEYEKWITQRRQNPPFTAEKSIKPKTRDEWER